MNAIDMTNKKIGKLLVIGKSHKQNNKGVLWDLVCECGEKRQYKTSDLNRGKIKSCGCFNKSERMSRPSPLIMYRFWDKFLRTSKRRGKKVLITAVDVEKKFLQQNKKCALSGLDINFPINSSEARSGKYTASIDRIDSTKPYSTDNIQIVHKKINMMKQHYSQKEFIELCKSVALKFGY